ncbi:MAG: gliding motility lipoprotein GldH [Saprospiraceae bacterium]
MKNAWWIGAISSFILISCDPPNYVYERSNYFTIDSPWVQSDSLVYNFQVKDTNRFYNLLLEIDHDKKYAFENLYVKFDTRFPDSTHKSDIVSIVLADETGDWISDCRGKACTFYLTLQDQAIFPQKGQYQIKIFPWMRSDTIQNIYRVAFKLEKMEKR